ncbi:MULTISPECIES: hypothetical protein [Paeniglutamicibacter]|uniref:Uncharacterized protein n=1 Tax=Paeniglutamicibacter sulfureus TaxID=43666 RepID=A0ABU2BLK4_9MICC|nr:MULTISPECIES: hypothetical protein [Paeniglutamicibacter]MCV9994235.1 hypothetical protein [Paeniglutamicibacter sp. ZC-3]MDO2934838.1 hypothetical protein [Paeniglutamicibacter sulfureus]MDR7359126.1 hypothetical protein [Paeniglutamicibacter sulfureus]
MAELRISARVSMGASWFGKGATGGTPPVNVSLVMDVTEEPYFVRKFRYTELLMMISSRFTLWLWGL